MHTLQGQLLDGDDGVHERACHHNCDLHGRPQQPGEFPDGKTSHHKGTYHHHHDDDDDDDDDDDQHLD